MVNCLLNAWPDVDLSALTAMELMVAIESVDLRTASENACVGAVVAGEQLRRYLAAGQAVCLERAADLAAAALVPPGSAPRDVFEGADLVGSEVAVALGMTPRQAKSWVSDAAAVCRELPDVIALVRRRVLDWATAVAVHTQMRNVLDPDDPNWGKVQTALKKALPGRNRERAVRATQRELEKADPEAALKRRRQAQRERQVRSYPLPDGMGGLTAVLDSATIMMITTVLDALADGCRDAARRVGQPDPRSHQQRRADALAAVFRSVQDGRALPFLAGPCRCTPAASNSAESSEGAVSHEPPSSDLGTGIGAQFGGKVLPLGHPVVPDSPAIVLGAGVVLGWWLPPIVPRQQGRRAGTPVPPPSSPTPQAGHGPGDQAKCTEPTTRYKPRQTVIDQVLGRFLTCVHPNCTRPAAQCDIDHAIPFAKGGKSCPCNLIPLCRRHRVSLTYSQEELCRSPS